MQQLVNTLAYLLLVLPFLFTVIISIIVFLPLLLHCGTFFRGLLGNILLRHIRCSTPERTKNRHTLRAKQTDVWGHAGKGFYAHEAFQRQSIGPAHRQNSTFITAFKKKNQHGQPCPRPTTQRTHTNDERREGTSPTHLVDHDGCLLWRALKAPRWFGLARLSRHDWRWTSNVPGMRHTKHSEATTKEIYDILRSTLSDYHAQRQISTPKNPRCSPRMSRCCLYCQMLPRRTRSRLRSWMELGERQHAHRCRSQLCSEICDVCEGPASKASAIKPMMSRVALHAPHIFREGPA